METKKLEGLAEGLFVRENGEKVVGAAVIAEIKNFCDDLGRKYCGWKQSTLK